MKNKAASQIATSVIVSILLVVLLDFNFWVVLITMLVLNYSELNFMLNYNSDDEDDEIDEKSKSIMFRNKRINVSRHTNALNIEYIHHNLYIDNRNVRFIYLKNGRQLSIIQAIRYFEYKDIEFVQMDNKLYLNDQLIKAIRFRDGKYMTVGQLITRNRKNEIN